MTLMLLPFHDHSYVRITSTGSGEVMLELKMLAGSIIVWGSHYRPDEADVRLSEDGTTVAVSGVLRDGQGIVVTFGEVIDVCEGFTVEAGELPADFDGAWQREH